MGHSTGFVKHRVSDMHVSVPFSCSGVNFLLHFGFMQVKPLSRVLISLELTLPKLVFGHVDDGFLNHSSAAATVSNISAASVRSWCIQFLC